MCPGVLIKAGGAGGGGSGAGRGKGKGGKKKAKGKRGKENAEGGKKNAAEGTGKCGGAGGCPNPKHGNGGSASAGDPVDVVTGRVYTIPTVDLALPGHLPLIIERSYNSLARERDVGLGFGWSHSLSWEIEARRRSGKVWGPEGTFWEFEVPDGDEPVEFDTAVLYPAGDSYVLFDQDEGVTYVFAQDEAVAERHRLIAIGNQYGHRIELRYQAGVLTQVQDSVGRTVAVRRGYDGRIAAFEVLFPNQQHGGWCFRRYRYDERGDLVAVSDADGNETSFAYDDQHRMVKKSNPEGFEVHHRYDRAGRCVETWCAYPGERNPALSGKASNVLADGSPAKGMLHVKLDYVDEGYTEVINSRGVRRYHTNAIGKIDLADSGTGVHTNTYDEFGKIETYTNAEQATWRWERDEHGNVVATVDPLGHTTSSAYDERGHLIQSTDENGISRCYDRDQYGALLAARDERGQLIANRYDDAGNPIEVVLPNGGVTRMAYDGMGNRVLVQEPNGATRHIEYDYLGRVVGMTDELGGRTQYTYGRRGELLLTELPNGARIRNVYDREGNLTHFTNGDGHSYELRYAALGLVYEVRKPDGTRACFRYDREGDLVEVENEKGEQHVIERSLAGYIVEDATFDGRRMRYAFDAGGQLTSVTEPGGEITRIQYDAVGRISGRSYADGTEDRFEYDGVGHLIASDNGTVACRFEYDNRGNLVRESQTFAGETHTVEHDYDAMGKVRETRTSLGYQQATSYDVMGNLVSVQLGDDGPVRFQRDVLGLEVARLLPGGGLVETRRDVMGMPISRRLLHAGGQAPAVGALEPQALHEQAYTWSLGGKLLSTLDSELGPTEYQYDPTGQLTARLPAHARREIFSYEPGGNLHDDEARRDYALGGLLLRRGNTAFVYDASHRLTEKHVDTSDGKQVWHYGWDGRGLLRAVTVPDGSTVEHTYDSYARRVQKRTSSKEGVVLSVVRYVWNGDHVVHELCESANDNAEVVANAGVGVAGPGSRALASRAVNGGGKGDENSGGEPLRREKTYAFAPESLQPLAHRVTAGRTDAAGDGARAVNSPWVHYLEGNAGTPELLVAGDGRILAHLDGKAFGRVTYESGAAAATDLRFYGHIEDPETGLFYNRYRHYDPDIGRYLSPEPLGLMGGLSPFGYAANDPVGMVDPDGLDPVTCVIQGQNNASAASHMGRDAPPRIHPVVEAAMAKDINGKYPNGAKRPIDCAEPAALSAYLFKWEEDNKEVLDPGNKEQVARALGSITSIEASQPGGHKRSPCPNCSQMFANLQAQYGEPTSDKIKPGYVGPKAEGEMTNFMPPVASFQRAEAAQSPNKPRVTTHKNYPK
jgi:RHS repeat-associated protein